MLEEVDVIVWEEERLYPNLTVDCSYGNVPCGIPKNCEQQSFAPVNQSSLLRLLQIVFKRKYQRC